MMNAMVIYILIGTFTPGPNNIMSSSTSSKIGVIKTLPFMFGVLVATFLVFSITGIFNIFLFGNVEIIKKYVGIIGAIYMSYLAFLIISSDNISESGKPVSGRLFFKGILLTFINPKAIIFGLTVTGIFLSGGFPEDGILALSLFLAVLCFISVLLWGSIGHLFMKFLSKYFKIFNIVMATLILYSAALVLFDTI